MPTLVLQGQGTFLSTALVLRRIYTITGVTRTPGGDIIPRCAVHLFRTVDNIKVDQTVSDTTGTYTVSLYDRSRYYAVGNTSYTCDSTLYSADITSLTADLTEYGGVTVNSLTGV